MELNLEKKHAFVCGSTRGIGRATAVQLAQLGARVILLARDEAALRRVREELPAGRGQRHDYICADFNDPEALREKAERFMAQNPPVHVLVNNTGGPPPGYAIRAEPQAFLKAFSMHLLCNQVLAQALVPGMKAEGYGRIVNVISTSVKQPILDLGVSNTIRGAVASWSKTLSRELGSFGITVNNVLPGTTKTGRLQAIIEDRARKSGKTTAEIEAELLAEIPAGRFGNPEEIAAAIAFLASPAASYINGVSLAVDGGKIACL